jgi:hypothetical protein
MSTTGNQMAALSVLATEYRQLAEQGRELVAAVGRPATATADRSAGQGVARIHLHEVMRLDRLFMLSEVAVGTWTPGEPASPLVGAKTHLPSIGRAVAAARKAGAPGVLPDLIARFQGTAAAWEKSSFTGAQIEGLGRRGIADLTALSVVLGALDTALGDYMDYLSGTNQDGYF